MKIPTSYLQERFSIFGYSTLYKYKNDKESKSFFESKKDFYMFLEANYLLELKARRKLIKILTFKDIYFFYHLKNIEEYIYQPNPIKSLIQNFKKLPENNFLYTPELLIEAIKYIENHKNKSTNEIQSEIKQLTEKLIVELKKKHKKQTVIENFEKKFLSKDISYFDQWVIIEMIINIKKYQSAILNKSINYEKFTQINLLDFEPNNNINILKIKIHNYNKTEIFFLEYNKKLNKIIIREKIQSNRNKDQIKEIRTKKLEEPKWVYFSENNRDIYIDHVFNFIEINYEDKYFQYNSVRFPLDILL